MPFTSEQARAAGKKSKRGLGKKNMQKIRAIEMFLDSSTTLNELSMNSGISHLTIYKLEDNYSDFKEVLDKWRVENNVPNRRGRTYKKEGYIYLFKVVGFNFYKIGMTGNSTYLRLCQVQSHMPFEVIEVHSIKSKDIVKVEKYLHKNFKNNHVRGEWFDLSPNQVEDLKSLMNNIQDGKT